MEQTPIQESFNTNSGTTTSYITDSVNETYINYQSISWSSTYNIHEFIRYQIKIENNLLFDYNKAKVKSYSIMDDPYFNPLIGNRCSYRLNNSSWYNYNTGNDIEFTHTGEIEIELEANGSENFLNVNADLQYYKDHILTFILDYDNSSTEYYFILKDIEIDTINFGFKINGILIKDPNIELKSSIPRKKLSELFKNKLIKEK
jgi:hypothetical protein